MLSLNKHYNLGELSYSQVDQNWDDLENEVNGLSARLPLNNYSATTDPTVNNDVTQGYSTGSLWYNRTTDTVFVLTNASSGAANWVERDSISASDLGSAAFADIQTSSTDSTADRVMLTGAGGLLASTLSDTPTINDFTADIKPGSYKASLASVTGGPDTGAYGASVFAGNHLTGKSFDVIRATINPANFKAWTGIRNSTTGSVTWFEVAFLNTPQTFTEDQTVDADLEVTGSLSKGSGSFRIKHPLPEKTETHHLVHSFIEGPQADLVYRGRATLVDGEAQVDIDSVAGMTAGTFVLLCRDVQAWAQNDTGWSPVRASVSGATITIVCQDSSSSDVVSWLVVGERQDPHIMETDWTDEDGRVIVEPEFTPPIETEED